MQVWKHASGSPPGGGVAPDEDDEDEDDDEDDVVCTPPVDELLLVVFVPPELVFAPDEDEVDDDVPFFELLLPPLLLEEEELLVVFFPLVLSSSPSPIGCPGEGELQPMAADRLASARIVVSERSVVVFMAVFRSLLVAAAPQRSEDTTAPLGPSLLPCGIMSANVPFGWNLRLIWILENPHGGDGWVSNSA